MSLRISEEITTNKFEKSDLQSTLRRLERTIEKIVDVFPRMVVGTFKHLQYQHAITKDQKILAQLQKESDEIDEEFRKEAALRVPAAKPGR